MASTNTTWTPIWPLIFHGSLVCPRLGKKIHQNGEFSGSYTALREGQITLLCSLLAAKYLLHPITQFMNVVDVDLPYYLKYFKLAPVRESNRVHDASSLQLHTSSKCEKYKATKHGDFAEWSKRSGSTCQHRYDLKVSRLPKLCGILPFPDSSFVWQDLCDETATQVSCWGKSNI